MNDAILHACDWRYADVAGNAEKIAGLGYGVRICTDIVFNHMTNDDRPGRLHIPGAAEHSLSGLPDLDLNQWVIDQQRACLRALNGMKSDGYR